MKSSTRSQSETRREFKTITIVGLGRFGKVLLNLLAGDFDIRIFTNHPDTINTTNLPKRVRLIKNLKEALQSETIFYCVPISKFETIINSHKKLLTDRQLIIDTLSVKIHPAKVLSKLHKAKGIKSILTHPIFGPDSSKNGFAGLSIVMDKFTSERQDFSFWKDYFLSKGLKVILINPNAHDKLAANSQGLTHFIGRLLKSFNFKPTLIDTKGAEKLTEIMDQTCNDSQQLFLDLQRYNPHTGKMRSRLGDSYSRVIRSMNKGNSKKIIFGIQGGRGSFNEDAVNQYIKNNKIKNSEIKYLFTTMNVMASLNRSEIDFGVFAISNSRGGLVDESLQALGKSKFQVIGNVVVAVKHFLMKRKDINKNNIKIIMAHNQVFKQCCITLDRSHPDKKLLEGKGNLKDTAKAAEALAKGKLPKHTAILGPIQLAKLFDLEIIDRDLQDDPDNRTTFLIVRA